MSTQPSPPSSLDQAVRDAVRSAVREILPEELARVASTLRAATATASPAATVYLTADEAAAHCGVSAKTIRSWAQAGKLRALRAGRQLRIERQALDEWLSAGGVDRTGNALDSTALARDILSRRTTK